MQEDIKKILVFIFFLVLALLFFGQLDRDNKITMLIEANGVEVHAKIIESHYSKRWIANIEYSYDGKKYNRDIGVPNFAPEAGDSILIKFLPDSLDKGILVKEKLYSAPHKSRFD